MNRFASAALAFLLLPGCERAPEPEPAQLVRAAIPAAGTAVIGRLGVSVRPGPNGLTVTAIDLDGPAAQAGAEVGDVLVGINGGALREAADLERAVKGAQEGFRLDLIRGGAPHQVAVRFAAPESNEELAWTPLGLQVKDLPDSARDALGITHGVMVTRIRAPADKTRLLPGDVIVALDREEVRNAAQFARLAAERRSGAVGLLVRRADADLFIPLEPGEGARAGANGGEASRGGGAPRLDERYKRRSPTGMPLRT